jgi:alkanesulfonate monooxygenase SsuD/methylene tetrahydromethanopterin reductase-like flavin-dependent oxidoreductase (luciferase family)
MNEPRFLVSIPPFLTDAGTVVDLAVDAERTGWDGVFLWDHLQWAPSVRPPVHDPWVLLGAIAQATERVRIGTLVTPLSRRRLQVVAKHLLTLDHLSHGRVTFAVGLGEPPAEDFADFGDESDPRVRAAMLDEGLTVLDQLLRGDTVDHDGKHYRVKAKLRPGPVQQPRPPIWVAGVAPHRRPLRRALRWDGVAPIGGSELLTPEALTTYLQQESTSVPEGWDVVVGKEEDISAEQYAEAGATWLVDSASPGDDGWLEEFRGRIRGGPPR